MLGAPQGDKGMMPPLMHSATRRTVIALSRAVRPAHRGGIIVEVRNRQVRHGRRREHLSSRPAGGPTNEPDKLQVFGEIPVDKLAPGDYVIRAIVQMEGQPEGKVIRTLRITK